MRHLAPAGFIFSSQSGVRVDLTPKAPGMSIASYRVPATEEENQMLYSPYNFLGFLILLLDIIAIISVVGGHSKPERKVLWTLAILFLPLVGMALYYLVG